MSGSLVWYACYGSNLSEERFAYYIKGGRYKEKTYYGCRDKEMWRETYTEWLPGRMYFAQKSNRWNGNGVAFYDEHGKGTTLMKLYLVTEEQFHDIKVQECGQKAADYAEREPAGWYSRTAVLGTGRDGYLMKTVTNEEVLEKNAPDDDYLEVIKEGLVKYCGLSDQEADSYLNRCKNP